MKIDIFTYTHILLHIFLSILPSSTLQIYLNILQGKIRWMGVFLTLGRSFLCKVKHFYSCLVIPFHLFYRKPLLLRTSSCSSRVRRRSKQWARPAETLQSTSQTAALPCWSFLCMPPCPIPSSSESSRGPQRWAHHLLCPAPPWARRWIHPWGL